MSKITDERSDRQSQPHSSARAALEVAREYPVFPCEPQTKRPLTEHGFKEASQDARQIRAWWQQWPQALIGVPTGAASDLTVVDCDPKSGAWFQDNRDRLGRYRLHQTRRGRHLLYRFERGLKTTSGGPKTHDKLDVRSEGGYIIWWPAHGGAHYGEPGRIPLWLQERLQHQRSSVRKLNGHKPTPAEDWDVERKRVIQALAQLDPDLPHDEWRDVAAAISWGSGGNQDGEDIFVEFSRGKYGEGAASKFPGEREVRHKYRSFKNDKDHNVTLATLYQLAKDAGGRVPPGRPQKKNGAAKDTKVLLVRADEVEEKPVDWLWKGFLARNKFHLLTGSGGVMKSTLTMSLAATITRGGKWPDGTRCEKPANVIIWTGEDDLADTVKPRFRFAGGRESRCWFIKGVRAEGQKRDFDPATDTPALEAACDRLGNVAMIVIDPIVSIVQKDNNSASDVRRSLAPLISLGMRYNAVILGLQHFTKGSKGRDPTERVLGSGAWTQAARIVLGAATVDEGDGQVAQHMVFACTKTFHKSAGGFEYTYEEEPDTEIARVVWGKQLEGTAHSIFREAEGDQEGGSKLGDAKRFLNGLLANGRQTCLGVMRKAEEAGVKTITLRRAARSMQLRKIREGYDYFWALPGDDGASGTQEARKREK